MRQSALCLACVLGAASGAAAEDISKTCADWIVRHVGWESSSDAADSIPPSRYWVNAGADTQGPMTAIEIKRAMLKRELPTGLWVRNAGTPGGAPDWTWSDALPDLDPLPTSPELRPDDLGTGLRALLTGCWVSDPATSDGKEVLVVVQLFENGVLVFQLSVLTLATGHESVRTNFPQGARWQVTGTGGPDFTLRLPELDLLAPNENFPGIVIDRNTILIEFAPGRGHSLMRRM